MKKKQLAGCISLLNKQTKRVINPALKDGMLAALQYDEKFQQMRRNKEQIAALIRTQK